MDYFADDRTYKTQTYNQRNKLQKTLQLRHRTIFREVNLFSFCPCCLFTSLFWFAFLLVWFGFLWHLYFFLRFLSFLSLAPANFAFAFFLHVGFLFYQSSNWAFILHLSTWQEKPSLILFQANLSSLFLHFLSMRNFILFSDSCSFNSKRDSSETLVKAGKHSLDCSLFLTLIFASSFISRLESSAEPSSPFTSESPLVC